MKALVIEAFGKPDVFKRVEVPKPEPKAGEVVVAARASSVNPVDYKIRDGRAARLCSGIPAVLRADCARGVAAVGAGVTTLEETDEVFAFANGMSGKLGALAEFMAVDACMGAQARIGGRQRIPATLGGSSPRGAGTRACGGPPDCEIAAARRGARTGSGREDSRLSRSPFPTSMAAAASPLRSKSGPYSMIAWRATVARRNQQRDYRGRRSYLRRCNWRFESAPAATSPYARRRKRVAKDTRSNSQRVTPESPHWSSGDAGKPSTSTPRQRRPRND